MRMSNVAWTVSNKIWQLLSAREHSLTVKRRSNFESCPAGHSVSQQKKEKENSQYEGKNSRRRRIFSHYLLFPFSLHLWYHHHRRCRLFHLCRSGIGQSIKVDAGVHGGRMKWSMKANFLHEFLHSEFTFPSFSSSLRRSFTISAGCYARTDGGK